jgi:hypothetical protein
MRTRGKGEQADEAQRHNLFVPVHVEGADGQVALEVAHATFDVAMVVIDTDHPIQVC